MTTLSARAGSRREDGRGHWPAGAPRSELRPGVAAALRAAKSGMSTRQMAASLGVGHSTVAKWLRGEARPNEGNQRTILSRRGCL